MQATRYCDCTPDCDVPYGYCHCRQCGEKTTVSPQTVRKPGYVKGVPRPYVFNHDKRRTDPQYEIVDLGYTTPCWVWQWTQGVKGYGDMRPRGSKTMRAAHIVYYERAKGPVPEGLELDHLCHDPDSCIGGVECPHRRCVNPDHLEPKTSRENSARGQTRPGSKHKPGRKPPAKPTHCKHGHEFTPENTIVRPNGWWRCRTCQNAQMLAYYYRTRGAKP